MECEVPVRTAYNQWTQFESFPLFMEGVEQVEQVDDTHLHWVARVGGKRVEWDAVIVGQEPDKLVSWASTSGRVNNGMVGFEPTRPGHCRVRLVVTYEPEGVVEKTADALGVVRQRIEGDLRRFKRFIEGRQVSTGSWRGRVRGGRVETPDPNRMRGGPRTPRP